MKISRELSHAILVEILEYRDDGKLYWKARVYPSAKCKVGHEAGYFTNGKGPRYKSITLLGKKYLIHRVVWFYHFGAWPSGILDHKDGDGLNNKIENLRIASQEQNFYNSKKSKNNKTGFKGVSFNKRLKKFRAQICIDKYNMTIGHYATAEEASKAYNEKAKLFHKEFYRIF